jgi:pterin-4a-carbinolamine dehydratase
MARSAVGNLIFISYRRTDVAPHAVALKLALEKKFAAVQVFLDTQSIEGGKEWPDALKEALASATVVVPLFGSRWQALDKHNKPRIEDPQDWVHRELLFSLENKRKEMIQVFVDDVEIPSKKNLPKSLGALATIQGIKISTEQWVATVDALANQIATKFGLDLRGDDVQQPLPNSTVAKAPPYPWPILVQEVRANLPNWHVEFTDHPSDPFDKRVSIARTFVCASFVKAVEFFNVVARLAEDLDHHPDVAIVWKSVTIALRTRDAGHRVTIVDYKFARFLDREFRKLTAA